MYRMISNMNLFSSFYRHAQLDPTTTLLSLRSSSTARPLVRLWCHVIFSLSNITLNPNNNTTKGAPVNDPDCIGQTPLFYAVTHCQVHHPAPYLLIYIFNTHPPPGDGTGADPPPRGLQRERTEEQRWILSSSCRRHGRQARGCQPPSPGLVMAIVPKMISCSEFYNFLPGMSMLWWAVNLLLQEIIMMIERQCWQFTVTNVTLPLMAGGLWWPVCKVKDLVFNCWLFQAGADTSLEDNEGRTAGMWMLEQRGIFLALPRPLLYGWPCLSSIHCHFWKSLP